MELEVTLKYTANLHNIRFAGENPREPVQSELVKFEEELSGEAYERALALYLDGGEPSGTFVMRDLWSVDYTLVNFEVGG